MSNFSYGFEQTASKWFRGFSEENRNSGIGSGAGTVFNFLMTWLMLRKVIQYKMFANKTVDCSHIYLYVFKLNYGLFLIRT